MKIVIGIIAAPMLLWGIIGILFGIEQISMGFFMLRVEAKDTSLTSAHTGVFFDITDEQNFWWKRGWLAARILPFGDKSAGGGPGSLGAVGA